MQFVSHKKILPAFLLSFFLGVFGAHRFYTGRVASGIVMLLLTLSLFGLIVSAIWNLVDWITILCGAFRDADGRKLVEWT
jgi:TM2 domain-containing membrane protein YozV